MGLCVDSDQQDGHGAAIIAIAIIIPLIFIIITISIICIYWRRYQRRRQYRANVEFSNTSVQS